MSALEHDEAFEAYQGKVYELIGQTAHDDAIGEHDDAILEMVSDYFGDGTDPLHPERASNRIIDSLGL